MDGSLPTNDELADQLETAAGRLKTDGLTEGVLADIERAFVDAEDRAICDGCD